VDVNEFKAAEAGRIVYSPEGYPAFVPAPLPPRLAHTRELAVTLSHADAALGRLCGLGDALEGSAALAAPFLRQEALCSSRIEGADVSLTEVLLDEIACAPKGSRADHLAEVRNTLATLAYGVECVARVPVDLDLVRSLHARLLRGEPATARTPGEFRTLQNWIGPPGATATNATYVPPPVPEMLELLAQLDSFMAERDRLPDLVQCALAHAQFESIHPFVGGNGRLGRILMVLFLVSRGRLSQPFLYLSAYLEAHRRQYYTLLQRLHTKGEWLPWVLFFAKGVKETADRAYRQVCELARQRGLYRAQADGSALRLVEELFTSPFIAVRAAQRLLATSHGTARRAIRTLESRRLLAPVDGTTRPQVYVARPILEAIEEPIEALVGKADELLGTEPIKSPLGWDRRPRLLADRLMTEAMAVVDLARRAGVDARLVGGLAVRRYCIDLAFAEREYSDVDLVVLSAQRPGLCEVFAGLGYEENVFVNQASEGQQMQFVKVQAPAASTGSNDELPDELQTSSPAPRPDATQRPELRTRPLVDHVDIFLDVMRMDHDVDVRDRLTIDDYAVRPVDALIVKAQIGTLNQKDAHDLIALFKDVPLREVDDDLSICVPRLAQACAEDWGLYFDVTTNLKAVLDWLPDFGLTEEEASRVNSRITAALQAIEDEEKPLNWRLRARLGTHVAWRRSVELQDGTPVVTRLA
jgi:Fic family protein